MVNKQNAQLQVEEDVSDAPLDHNFKVVLLGEACVGKTSIALRLTEDSFETRLIEAGMPLSLDRMYEQSWVLKLCNEKRVV